MNELTRIIKLSWVLIHGGNEENQKTAKLAKNGSKSICFLGPKSFYGIPYSAVNQAPGRRVKKHTVHTVEFDTRSDSNEGKVSFVENNKVNAKNE